jgi:hypothetical protein
MSLNARYRRFPDEASHSHFCVAVWPTSRSLEFVCPLWSKCVPAHVPGQLASIDVEGLQDIGERQGEEVSPHSAVAAQRKVGEPIVSPACQHTLNVDNAIGSSSVAITMLDEQTWKTLISDDFPTGRVYEAPLNGNGSVFIGKIAADLRLAEEEPCQQDHCHRGDGCSYPDVEPVSFEQIQHRLSSFCSLSLSPAPSRVLQLRANGVYRRDLGFTCMVVSNLR